MNILLILRNILRPLRIVHFGTDKLLYSPQDSITVFWKAEGALYVWVNGRLKSAEGKCTFNDARPDNIHLVAVGLTGRITAVQQVFYASLIQEQEKSLLLPVRKYKVLSTHSKLKNKVSSVMPAGKEITMNPSSLRLPRVSTDITYKISICMSENTVLKIPDSGSYFHNN